MVFVSQVSPLESVWGWEFWKLLFGFAEAVTWNLKEGSCQRSAFSSKCASAGVVDVMLWEQMTRFTPTPNQLFLILMQLGQRMLTDTIHSLSAVVISSLTPSNCPILDDKELHEAHPWFEFLVRCRGVASNPRGRSLASLSSCSEGEADRQLWDSWV